MHVRNWQSFGRGRGSRPRPVLIRKRPQALAAPWSQAPALLEQFELSLADKYRASPSTFTEGRNPDNKSLVEIGCASSHVREICAAIASAVSAAACAGLAASAYRAIPARLAMRYRDSMCPVA